MRNFRNNLRSEGNFHHYKMFLSLVLAYRNSSNGLDWWGKESRGKNLSTFVFTFSSSAKKWVQKWQITLFLSLIGYESRCSLLIVLCPGISRSSFEEMKLADKKNQNQGILIRIQFYSLPHSFTKPTAALLRMQFDGAEEPLVFFYYYFTWRTIIIFSNLLLKLATLSFSQLATRLILALLIRWILQICTRARIK